MWVQASPVLGGESQGQRVLQTGPRCQDLPVPYSRQISPEWAMQLVHGGGSADLVHLHPGSEGDHPFPHPASLHTIPTGSAL